MARRLTTLRRGSVKHNNAWSAVISSDYITIPAASKVLLGALALSNTNIDETILRVIGSVNVNTDTSSSQERQIGSVGLIVVSNNAQAAGVASIPGPSTDSEDDGWFCHAFFAQTNPTGADPDAHTYNFSSKGRRIVQEGELIAIVAENSHASHGFILNLQFRLLSRVTGT